MARQPKAPVLKDRSWATLNDTLRDADVETCRALLNEELASTSPRKQFVLRIHSRFNRARALVERRELMSALRAGRTVTL